MMGKFLVRITIFLVSVYFLFSYIVAHILGINLFENYYVLLFELIAVVYCYSEGKYHCKYLKTTTLAIFLSDSITRLDYAFDFLSVEAHNLIPILILSLGMSVSLYKSISHFIRVKKIRKQRNHV